MARILITAKLVREAVCPAGKARADYFDTQLSGFVLEVRASGGKTFYVRYRNQRGMQKQHKVGRTDHLSTDEARKRAQKILSRIATGQDPTEERNILRTVPTFSEFVNTRYLPFIQNYKRSWRTDHSILRNHLLPRLGRLHLDQITKNDATEMHHRLRAAGAAPASANCVLVLLRYMFNLALKWEIPGVTKNPTSGVPLFEENNKRERYLSAEETRRLHAAVLQSANPQLRFIVPILILTGARKREVLDARWEDFDLIRRQWRIPVSKNGKARHVPISNDLALLLEMVPRFESCAFVVPDPKTLKAFVTFFHSWSTARTQAGLEDLHVHDLRHSFASFLINCGRSLYEVQQILGHAQIHTTQRYAHLSQATLLDAANAATQAIGVTFAPTRSQGAEVRPGSDTRNQRVADE